MNAGIINTEKGFQGFTIIELMIVVALLAVLAALAYPSYNQYVRKANRGEAQQLLMTWSVNQEIWRANNTSYATTGNLAAPTHDKYNFSTTGTLDANNFTLRADPSGDQANDKQDNVDCDPLDLNQSGTKLPAACWE
jgi:type IV pilus assembly protein PilE